MAWRGIFFHSLVGLLFCSFVDTLVGWPVSFFVDGLAHQLVDWLVGLLVSLLKGSLFFIGRVK